MLAALVVMPGWAQRALAATQHLRIRSDAPAAPADGSEAGRRTTTVPSALDPQITITSNRDTIFSTLEDLRLLLKRSESGNRLSVTVKLEQDRDWLTNRSHDVTIRAGDTVADLTIPRSDFKSDITRSGDLTATVEDVDGYETANAKATVHVISQADPVVTLSLSEESYTFAEDVGRARARFVARMAPGMPRAVTVAVLIGASGKDASATELTATSGEDFEPVSGGLQMIEGKYEIENGRWVGRTDVILPLLDDDVREGTETFELQLAPVPELSHTDAAQLLNPDGTACEEICRHLIHITDEEDIPEMELSVNPEEITEEDEASATATLSITDDKSFATDQLVTLALGGTATKGADYVVVPADADQDAEDYQVILPVESRSVAVTLKAMRDDVDDPDEKIEVSALLEGSEVDDVQAVQIMQQQQEMPKITVAASRDTIIAGLEVLTMTLTREAPLDDALTVTVRLTQEQSWLSDTSRDVTFAADDADTDLILVATTFSSSVVESGNLTVAVDSVDGYDTGEATATVFVISQDGPAVTVSLTHSPYLFEEDADSTAVVVTARMAAGAPRGARVLVSVLSEGRSASRPELTAVLGEDYAALSKTASLEDWAMEGGRWMARDSVAVTLLDDQVREGRERFRVYLQHDPGFINEVQLLNPDTTVCSGGNECRYLVFIDDDEDIPEWDLSVSEEEIREEDETSSTATLSITNGKTFAADQVVTFAFAGTATEDDDYLVTPADADGEAAGHQVSLSAGSTSLGITLTAVDDEVEDSNEAIEVSATLGGEAIGSTQTIHILNQEARPKITLAASRDTIIAGLETLVLTATREAPLDSPVAVTLQLAQEQDWLSRTSHQLNFAAHGSTANLNLSRPLFSSAVTESGTLRATLDSVGGYDTGDATATVYVVSQSGPAIMVSFAGESYRFAEDEESPAVTFVARAAAGMPRGARFTFSVSARSGTAASPGDYQAVSEVITVQEEDFTLEDGTWQARPSLSLTLVDDDVREGDESFEMLLEMLPGHPSEVQLSDLQGEACRDDCATPVEITDDEDIPAMGLSLNTGEIHEEGETSSTATLSITNGKTFATDQMLTFELGGDAIAGHDYTVTPADADEGASHQVILAAGSRSVEVLFTAIDDEREEGDERITFRVTHDGDAIDTETIRIIDRFPGPRVEVTFEGVEPPDDDYTAGIATGPFTTRFTFSEPVDGFTEEDIDWQTQAGTTEDSTSIGVILWDFTEVRAGLEYTVEMMPTQKGRLWILVFPGKTTSVGTGDGNQLGANSLWVRFPPDRLLVAPAELTVDEGDAEGAFFLVVLTSAPTDTVKVTVSGIAGTEVEVDPSTLMVGPRFWREGRGMDVTAGSDANTSDETVSLTVRAWGGGYEGRNARVVVRVKDGGGGHVQGMSEDDALTLVDDVTPEAAAAALFDEGDLSAAQLDALDLLGNRNGDYDLGDLMSWMERCRRGGASCGSSLSPDIESVPGAAVGMLGLAVAGGSGRTGGRKRRGSGETRGSDRSRRVPRRPGRAWFGLVLLLAAAMTSGCTDDVMQTTVAEADPGYLTVQLTAPAGARDMAAMLIVEGPGIESVRAPGFELFQSDPSSRARRQVIVSGALSTGSVMEFQVPDRRDLARYTVRLRQVAGKDYTLRDLSRYTAVISR